MTERSAEHQSTLWPWIAVLLSLALAALMILNNQMAGEAMWFWYGTVFRQGAKLYSVLHTPLQPLFVLEISTWLRLFGDRLLVFETLSLIHACVLASGLFLILRESRWPGWQRGVVLLGAFVYIVIGHSYRFDDYHVVAESLMTYALLLLLILGRPDGAEQVVPERRTVALIAALGVLCGLMVVTRVNDGAALIVGSAICLPFLLRRRQAAGVMLFAGAAALAAIVVVLMTGDTLGAYLSNSIFRAAGSKGGGGSIAAAPLRTVQNAVELLLGYRQVCVDILLIVLCGFLIARYRKRVVPYIVPIQLVLAALLFVAAGRGKQRLIAQGLYFETLVLLLMLALYGCAAWVLIRYVRHRQRQVAWDRREILILLPLLLWASYTASSAADPLLNYYAPLALFLVLVPELGSLGAAEVWIRPSLVTLLGLVAASGIVNKAETPYAWQNYRFPPMFAGRHWYQHPVYGPMYMETDLLRFSRQLCTDIGAIPGKTRPELLSLPYPYGNYFCSTPPWHNYVQTFFDTATRSTVQRLMQELNADPPEWIVYQRQLNIMRAAERLYNHGQPLAQRELDAMIMSNLASGRWTLVDRSDYLRPDNARDALGTGWFVIRTRPPDAGTPGLPKEIAQAAEAEGHRPEVQPEQGRRAHF